MCEEIRHINIQMLKEVNFYPLEHRFDIIESEKKISVPFGETIKKGDLVVVWHNSQKLISAIDPSWKCQSSDFVDNDTYRIPGDGTIWRKPRIVLAYESKDTRDIVIPFETDEEAQKVYKQVQKLMMRKRVRLAQNLYLFSPYNTKASNDTTDGKAREG